MADSDHRLWVSLSALGGGGGNVFAVLPQLMKQMLAEEGDDFADIGFADVVLPSDDAWQTKIYYQLVEKQRMADAGEDDEMMLDPMDDETPKLHEWNTLPQKPKLITCAVDIDKFGKNSKIIKGRTPITWTVSDIFKAGCLLKVPPFQANFEDEQEMRRVYTLIYDVFRYKNVLTQALTDVSFFQVFPKLNEKIPHVWLLLFDLYHRQFKKRDTNVAVSASRLFDINGLSFVENALWTQRIKLAAAVARLRIKNNALSLSELLPAHLQDKKVMEQAKTNPVTCWVNSTKVSDIKALCQEIEKEFNLKIVTDTRKLDNTTFKWDRHCPQIIAFHSSIRPTLAKSDFIRKHRLIVQDKSFCLGPASFDKLIRDLELTGSVIQTHVNSPRATAYLATLLSNNQKIKKLMAFSAGKRKTEYESYFTELGMTNIKIFSDRLIDTPADATYMEEVVAVFATPPNSYSAVIDPIDLVCSRGGDLSMLETLTESEDTKESRERVAGILDEQRRTLRFAMSRPQIQFVLYETHSELEAENDYMVSKALREINKIARIQHANLQGKILGPQSPDETDSKEINNNEKMESEPNLMGTESGRSVLTENENNNFEERVLQSIEVPETDIFDKPDLPLLCPSENCKNFEKEGCYLALLQRKQIIRLDDKYMIQMAETRGLFGSVTNTTSMKSKTSKTTKKKLEKEQTPQRPKKKLKEAEIDRIAAPTHTFLRHTRERHEVEICKRCDVVEDKSTIYKKWWQETTRHIVNLKKSLVKQKILPVAKIKHANTKAIVDSFWEHTYRVDEVVRHNNLNSHIPIFPKLRLKREMTIEKVQIPLSVTSVEFPIQRIIIQGKLF